MNTNYSENTDSTNKLSAFCQVLYHIFKSIISILKQK